MITISNNRSDSIEVTNAAAAAVLLLLLLLRSAETRETTPEGRGVSTDCSCGVGGDEASQGSTRDV